MTASALGRALIGADRESALRLAIQFADDFRAAPRELLAQLVNDPAPMTGDQHLDALVAGLVEHLCGRAGVASPIWVEEDGRFLDSWWFVAELPKLRALALVESPAALRRRGVFVTEGFLASA